MNEAGCHAWIVRARVHCRTQCGAVVHINGGLGRLHDQSYHHPLIGRWNEAGVPIEEIVIPCVAQFVGIAKMQTRGNGTTIENNACTRRLGKGGRTFDPCSDRRGAAAQSGPDDWNLIRLSAQIGRFAKSARHVTADVL